MSVKAKFTCNVITQTVSGRQISLSPVLSGSEENKSFSLYTPAGSIELTVTNPDAFNQFEVGKQYYVTFDEAPQ